MEAIKELESQVNEKDEIIEELELTVKLVTLNNMYTTTILSYYENMINEIMNENCLGLELKQSKIKLEKLRKLYFKLIITEFIKSDTDFLRTVDNSTKKIISNLRDFIQIVVDTI